MDYIHFFSALGEFVESFILAGGYVFIFLFTVLEGIPLLGMLVPGHIAVILAGFFVKIGLLNGYWTLTLALSGAIIGDFFGFYIGRKFGMSFIDRFRPYFFIKDEYIEKARGILHKHTGKAMILGRFSPVTRAIMPFLVGTSGAHVHKFWLYNIIGAIAWVGSSMLLGYVFGSGYHIAAQFFGKFVLFAIVSAVIIIWGYRFINTRFHIFKKFELIVLGLNLISLYAFAKTVQDAWSAHSFMANFDVWVNAFVEMHVTPTLIWISNIISNIGSVTVLEIVGVVIGLLLLSKRRYRSSAIMISSVLLTGLATGMCKDIFMRARPDNQYVALLTDPSFPSGHSAVAAAFFVALLYVSLPKIHSWVKRELYIVLGVVSVMLVGLSRLVLGVHWFSDVLAGWALGICVATGVILLIRYIGVLVKK